MVHVAKLAFEGDPNVGLHGVATDRFCLIGKSVRRKYIQQIEDALKVPVIQANVYGTGLVGIFVAANSQNVLIPSIIFERERKELEKALADFGVKITTIKTEHTALGNNILLSDRVCISSTVFPKEQIDQIKKVLRITPQQFDIAGLNVPGSAGVITNLGAIFNSNVSDAEIKKIEKLLGFEIGIGNVNMGNPFVRSGLIANSNGFIVGGLSSGYEIARIDESLGFLK